MCVCVCVCKCMSMHSCWCGFAGAACDFAFVALLIKYAALSYFMRRVLTGTDSSRLSDKRHDFRKKLLNIKCAFWFSLHLSSKKCFYSEKNLARYCHKCENVFLYRRTLMKVLFCGQIFQKNLNIVFHPNPCNGSRVVPCGLTDGKLWSKESLFVILRKRLKNVFHA